jgi:hypothetical protein
MGLNLMAWMVLYNYGWGLYIMNVIILIWFCILLFCRGYVLESVWIKLKNIAVHSFNSIQFLLNPCPSLAEMRASFGWQRKNPRSHQLACSTGALRSHTARLLPAASTLRAKSRPPFGGAAMPKWQR